MDRSKRFIAVLAIFVIALSSCGISRPSEQMARSSLEEKIAEESSGLVSLQSFKKTNGVERNVLGTTFYQVEWVAEIRFNEDVRWTENTLSAKPLPKNENIWEQLTFDKKMGRNSEIIIYGNTKFEKAENGWRPIELIVSGYRIVRSEKVGKTKEQPPASVTIRDECLAWKCGSNGKVLDGGRLIAFSDYENPDSKVVVPGGTPFNYIETVSVTTKPGVTEVVTPFQVSGSDHSFERGDVVYIYADWGEGCVSVWANGHRYGFGSSELPGGGHDKTKIDCIPYEDGSTGNQYLKYPNLEDGNTERWTYAEFVVNGDPLRLYFQDHDAISTE